jgi:hypothetical protein
MRHDLKRTLAATPSRKINHFSKKKQAKSAITYYPFFQSDTQRANNPPHFGSARSGFSTELSTVSVD